MSRVLIVLILLNSCFSLSYAQCSGQSTTEPQHVVELYTSEGCNSCPPAEKWMSTLGNKPGLIGLEFHVDYWDDAQWRDPFSDHLYTLRQQVLSKRGNQGSIFTPQIWLDGQVWKNWPKGAPPKLNETVASPLRVSVDDKLQVRVEADAALSKPEYRLYAALTQSGLTEYVRGGENRGKHLDHDNVVRAFVGPLPVQSADIQFKIPVDLISNKAAVVAFVQNENDGHIVQTARSALQCSQ